jgi:DUF4097 and DUF4098 domain-containing protein YvlB
MKRSLALGGLILTVCALASAQEETGTRVVVAPSNTARPRVVRSATVNAAITVRTHAGTDVIVEMEGGRSRRRLPERTPDGLHRIDMPEGLRVTEEDNAIVVHAPVSGGNVLITVPVETSLRLKSVSGSIRVEGVHGDVEVSTTNASLELTNIAGSIVADSTNGSIRASMDRVDPSKPLSFSTVNGPIDVTLPADVRASVRMRRLNGSIWTDFEMRVNGTISNQGMTTGTINGGGVDINLSTLNGRITLRKK